MIITNVVYNTKLKTPKKKKKKHDCKYTSDNVKEVFFFRLCLGREEKIYGTRYVEDMEQCQIHETFFNYNLC